MGEDRVSFQGAKLGRSSPLWRAEKSNHSSAQLFRVPALGSRKGVQDWAGLRA